MITLYRRPYRMAHGAFSIETAPPIKQVPHTLLLSELACSKPLQVGGTIKGVTGEQRLFVA
jgi:hypothetical protein